MNRSSPVPAHPASQASTAFFYAAVLAGLCLFYWLLCGNAVFRNDELQHLHAAFSASEGKLPYRDYFDNHVPAFQFLGALEIRALRLKPSADLPVMMRHLSLPWLAAQLLLLVLISRTVFYEDRENYLSTAALAAAVLPFMATQARPEPLWGTLFFLSLYLYSSRPPTVKRFLLVGLVNGLNACVSLKTLAFPVVPELLAVPFLLAFYPAGLAASAAAALLGGLLFFPGLLVLYYFHAGAMPEFLKFAILYSIHGGGGGAGHLFPAAAALVTAAALSWCAVRYLNPRRAAFLTVLLFSLAVLSLYPVREAQTLFPFRGMAYLAAAALLVRGLLAVLPGVGARRAALLCLLSGLLYGRVASENAFHDNNDGYRKALGVMLKLQPGPGGTVMDAKGESIFWRRPFFYALETFAVQGVRSGAIKDSVPEDSAREATPVVFVKYPDRFTPLDMRFFSSNYLPVCAAPQVMAAGKELGGKSFETPLALDYRLVCQTGSAAGGAVDGKKYYGAALSLAAGLHSFKVPSSCTGPLLVWDRAARTGALPCGYGENK